MYNFKLILNTIYVLYNFITLVFVRFVYVSSKSFILYDIKNTSRKSSKLTWDKDSTKKYKYLKKKEHISIKNKKVQLWHNDALTMIYNTNMSMTSWISKTSSFRLIHTAQASYLFSNFRNQKGLIGLAFTIVITATLT